MNSYPQGGAMIRNARTQRQLSLREMGEQIGLDGSQLSKIEKGNHWSLPTIERVCAFLELPIWEVIRGMTDQEMAVKVGAAEGHLADLIDEAGGVAFIQDLASIRKESEKAFRMISNLVRVTINESLLETTRPRGRG